MNVVIVHFHLNRGGVTSVIANHLRALDRAAADLGGIRAAVVYGGRNEGWNHRLREELTSVELSLCAIPELEYDDGESADPVGLYRRLRDVLSDREFSPDETVLHVHNHSLGKNVSLPGALAALADDGFAQLLQIHDFAEDMRPGNYQRLAEALPEVNEALYPQQDRVHFAVLNGRDRAILSQAVDASQVHFLPNPVPGFGELPAGSETRETVNRATKIDPGKRLIVSPVRGIRRKNVGEMLLWAALFGDEATFALTLPPINPVEQPAHQFWKSLSSELDLACLFDLGTPEFGLSFPEVLAACDAVLTTSVAEGFGMVFLESWLAGRPLVGRDLPEITADFKAAGLQFDWLAPEFRVPVDIVGKERFRSRFRTAYTPVCESFGVAAPSPEVLNEESDGLIRNGSVDFAYLDRELQAEVIRRVCGDGSVRAEIRAANPIPVGAMSLESAAASQTVGQNAAVVRERYSLAGCGRRLGEVYDALLTSPRGAVPRAPRDAVPRDAVPRDAVPRGATRGLSGPILESFLRVPRFHPIRCEE